MRALGVSSLKRSAQLPDVPTIHESGVPDYELIVWYAIFAPARTPKANRDRLHDTLLKVIASPDVRRRMEDAATEPTSSTPEELAQYSRREVEKWRKVAQDAGIKID